MSSGPGARRRPGALALVSFAAFGVFLASGLVDVLSAAGTRLAAGWKHRDEDGLSARRRRFGPYADGIEAIRRRMPVADAYLVVEEYKGGGAMPVVAYDLAPRRAFVPSRERPTAAALRSAGAPPDAPPWVVVARGERRSPLLLTREEFFGR